MPNILPVGRAEQGNEPRARAISKRPRCTESGFETLKAISRVAIGSVRKKLSGEEARPLASSGAVLPTLESLGPPAAAPGASSAGSAIESLVSGPA